MALTNWLEAKIWPKSGKIKALLEYLEFFVFFVVLSLNYLSF